MFTEEQRRVIEEKKDTCIIAGPGTGKTFTLIGKIKYLLEHENIPADKIFVLSYAVKTSQELKEKLKKEGLENVKVDTFHGLAYDLWKEHFSKIPPLIQEEEKKKILKNLFPKLRNPLSSPENKKLYFKFLKKKGLLDFELLLLETAKLPLSNFSGYYIFIDEFQDTSPEILKFLSLFKNATFFLFGDPNQSIYGFRGVDLFEIKNFWDTFRPQMKVFSLTRSFRCPEEILKSAERFKASPWQVESFKSDKKGGMIQGFFLENTKEEGKYLARFVKNLLGGLWLEEQKFHSVSPGEIFILSRIKHAFLHLKDFFISEGIPVNFPEEGAEKDLKLLENFLKEVEGSIFPVQRHIENTSFEIRFFLQNLWELAQQDKEKFLTYLKRIEKTDFMKIKKEGVNFLSIHASKGLEAEYIILIGGEKGLIPLEIYRDTSLEEEKRLLYVAITRAKTGFYFTSVKDRKIFNFTFKEISPYLKNFPIKRISPKPKKPRQSSLF